MIEYLILDYQRENEARCLLESIKKFSKFDYRVTYLSNGGRQDYVLKLKEEGLIDKLILNSVNVGGGAATIQLFAQCESKYAIYLQVDHELSCEINQQNINFFIDIIENQGIAYIDLAGDQGRGNYSERAQFMPVHFYNSIPKSIGGPGPWENMEWTESYVQRYIKDNNLKFISIFFEKNNQKIPLFLDKGKWSFRSNPDGSEWKHRTDTKELWMLKKPTSKFSFPRFSDREWEEVLKNGWIDGKIPENEIKDSFNYWK
jgi:hypothetical protein